MATIPLDDATTYEQVFHKALTSGVFQFESGGMRDVLRRYKPNSVEDLTALNALYRPGPIQGGMIDDFIERKWGARGRVRTARAEGDPARDAGRDRVPGTGDADLERLAGYSLGDADLLRRAMGKKDAERWRSSASAL
jgi:DNA polymerase-3 subunit alpha